MSQKSKEQKLLPSPTRAPEEEQSQKVETGGEGYRVLLFNDEHHVMDEVAGQIRKALNCTWAVAEEIMMRAHMTGSAVVIIAARRKADRVASILREIALVVRVDKV
jgi:ATP-dependent Clp protease adaptor protein ClpS